MLLLRSILKNGLPLLVFLGIVTFVLAAEEGKTSSQAASTKAVAKKKDPYAWQTLFDGKTLKGWKTPDFLSEGKVSVADGCILLGEGNGITGISFDGKPPLTNYEIEYQAKRLKGDDFFGSVTIPVGKEHCSVIIGGWGGSVVGISSLDYFDAGENSTTQDYPLESKKWYTIRVRTSDARIEVWIDKEQVIDQPRTDHKFDVRFEIEDCKPLGIASWCTEAAIRNIKLRKLRPEEVKAAAKLREGEAEE